MLDSLGLGEVFMLALLALIFFGPENLPRMAARLGRWIGTLTRTSRTFLTEWREEALAVQDAVAQVRQIRDELYAARADISGTLNAARTDVDQALDTARAGVKGQFAGATAALLAPVTTNRLPAAGPKREGSPTVAVETETAASEGSKSSGNDGGAIGRTQAILEQLARKRASSSPPLENLPSGERFRGGGEGGDLTPGNLTPSHLTPSPSPRRRGGQEIISSAVTAERGGQEITSSAVTAKRGRQEITPGTVPARRGEPETSPGAVPAGKEGQELTAELEAVRAQVAEMAAQVAALRAELAEMGDPAPALVGAE